MFELRGVRAGYGDTTVLRGVDLCVPPSSVVALLGPNGAGRHLVAGGVGHPSLLGRPTRHRRPDLNHNGGPH